MDIENAKKVLEWIKSGKVKILVNWVKIPSPFALNILLQGHLDLMKIEEKQEFLKRMHQVYIQEIENKSKTLYADYQDL